MKFPAKRLEVLLVFVLWQNCAGACAGDESPNTQPPKTGPATEKRFPPLKVPTGFKATLFACDPLIEYPSAISIGPRPGAIFVAVDYMTGLGTEIVRRSEIRLVEDTNGDGYADKATVFAGGFNSIMGLAYHGDILHVMHAPLLTALRDTKGTGVADERKDLVSGLGLTPEQNPVRLHCANGVVVGHDGWLYLALGDHGCEVKRLEGDRLVLQGGGILRCRPDGRDLHIFATGLRNIYDVALDAELNVFVRDNENDGGDYKVRVCHSFFGADHGYPYLYYERPSEALPPLADLGLGSSAGGACYLERHFPEEYRGNAFFCEWGKSLVRYPLRRDGSTFASPKEIEFAAGAERDPYGFKPTDVVVHRDGTLMVSDYADGQRPKRGRGRIYHISYVGEAKKERARLASDPLAMLDSESYFERCDAQAKIERAGAKGLETLNEALAAGRIGPRGRRHAIWILVHLQGAKAIEPLLAIASSDPEPSIRAQAMRAIADLTDPILARHRLDAGPGDASLAARLAALGKGQDGRGALEIVVALGRLRWSGTADWLKENVTKPDAALAHAAMQALRQSRNWPAILNLIDAPIDHPLRAIALRAAAGQYDAGLIDCLLERLFREADAVRLLEYADCLTRVYKKPGPWVYWDYRPKPRPANQVSWERTTAIADGLNRILSHIDPDVRLAALKRMQREKVPASVEALGKWLSEDSDPKRVTALLDLLRDQPVSEIHRHLEPVIRSPLQTPANRLVALHLFVRAIDKENADPLMALAESLEDGPVLAETLRRVSKYPKLPAAPLLARKLVSKKPEVRAAAIEALGEVRAVEGREPLVRLLGDQDPQVRRAAAGAAGKLQERRTIESLLKLAADSDPFVRAASLNSLRMFKEPRAARLAAAALGDRHTQQIALQYLHELGGPEQAAAVVDLARRNPSLEMLTAAVQVLTSWRDRPQTPARQQHDLDRAVAEIQGATGCLVRWYVSGPTRGLGEVHNTRNGRTDSSIQFAAGTEGRVRISAKGVEKGNRFQARTDITVADQTDVEFLVSTSGCLQVWLNGTSIYHRDNQQTIRIESDCFPARLAKGNNQLVVSLDVRSPDSTVEYHISFRRKSAIAQHERLAKAVVSRLGNAERGREVLFNVEKSLCLKCHRVNDHGESIGPELTGLGSRFSRIYIAESILEPSRTIAPSFGTMVLRLGSGQTHSGVKVAESERMLTLADNQGQRQTVAKTDIEAQSASSVSTMPEGLEKRITEEEFVDLIAFLASLKESRTQDRAATDSVAAPIVDSSLVLDTKVTSTEVAKFGVFEQAFTQQRSYRNPYAEVNADATFVEPGGRERAIPLYWDGAAQWKVRFSPDVVGAWRWSVSSNDPGLDGKKAAFKCVPSANHGGIMLMKGYPYHFQYQDGTPYWLFGDTQWESFADDPRQGLDGRSMSQYFALRAKQGYNYVHTEIIGLVRSSNIDARGREQPAFQDYKAETINPAYFHEVDARVRQANSLGITLGLILMEPYFTPAASIDPTYRYDNRCWMSFPDEGARLRYARYAVARYSAFHVLFLLTLEWGPNSKPIKRDASVAMFNRIGTEIQNCDPHQRLRGIHDDNGALPNDFYGPSSGWNALGQYAQHSGSDYQFPWCDNCGSRNDAKCRGRFATPKNRQTLHNEMLDVRVNRNRNRPVINAEYAYYLRRGMAEHPTVVNRGHSHDRATFRKAAWVLTMAGNYIVPGFWRTYYGGWAGRNSPFQPDDPEALPAIKDLQTHHAFFTRLANGSRREWWKLVPHDDLVSTPKPADGPAGYAYCLADPGQSYVVYIENTNSADLILKGPSGATYKVTRFDPRTANRQTLQMWVKAGTTCTLSAPDTEDWVFEVEKE